MIGGCDAGIFYLGISVLFGMFRSGNIGVIGRYLKNLLISLDQLANTLIGGDPDETISSRAGKAAENHDGIAWRMLCRALHWIDPNHCRDAIEADEGKDQIV